MTTTRKTHASHEPFQDDVAPAPANQYVELAKKVARTMIQTFLAVVLIGWIGIGNGDHTATGLIGAFQTYWNAAAGAAVLAGVLAGGWGALLDPSRIPSLAPKDS